MDLIRLNPSESGRIKLNQIDSKQMNFLQNNPNACEKLFDTTLAAPLKPWPLSQNDLAETGPMCF